MQATTEEGTSGFLHPCYAELVSRDDTRFNVEKHGRLYYIYCTCGDKTTSDSGNYTCDLQGCMRY